MAGKTLGELLAFLENTVFYGGVEQQLDREVLAIRRDSREIREGELFIAVKGFEADGHRYLPQAAAAGALAAVVEMPDKSLALPQICVPDPRLAQALLAAAFYDHPSRELSLCGITGSNGKTSCSLMYRSIVEAAAETCGLIGTVEYRSGRSTVESKMTTPDALDLQRYLREMVESGFRHAVMEVSSIGLTQSRNAGTAYAAAVFLNLGREHLDYHGDMEHYYQAKKRLFRGLREGGIAILNADDAYGRRLAGEVPGAKLLFGQSGEAGIRAEKLDLSSGFAHFDLVIEAGQRGLQGDLPCGRYPLSLKVAGRHSVMNALAAMSLALAVGFKPEICKAGIEAYAGVERRFQEVYRGKYRIFDDHFANEGNIRMSLGTLAAMDYQKLWIVYAVRGNRGVRINRDMLETLGEWLPRLRLAGMVGSLSRDTTGHYDWVRDDEIEVYRETCRQLGLLAPLRENLEDAVLEVLGEAGEGDVVLLAGCQGMDAGARLALNWLASLEPERSEAILQPLKNRVCGWS